MNNKVKLVIWGREFEINIVFQNFPGEEVTSNQEIPKSVLIPREKEKRVVALMCNYKFDMEHGLAIVFENEQFKTVGPQDIIL